MGCCISRPASLLGHSDTSVGSEPGVPDDHPVETPSVRLVSDLGQPKESQRDQRQGPLTFGVEFEFVLAASMDEDFTNEFRRPEHRLDPDDLLENEFPPVLDPAGGFLSFGTLLLPERADYALEDGLRRHNLGVETGESLDYDTWVIKKDASIYSPYHFKPNATRFSYTGVEVVSPILQGTAAGFDEAEKVANILDTEFLTQVNRTCGLHIHVGNGKEGFDLPTLKNLISVLWVFDRQIIRLHPRYRKSISGGKFCESLVIYVLGRFPEKGQLRAKLEEFYSANEMVDLLLATRHLPKGCAYNMLNLEAWRAPGEFGWGYSNTIEFRQHEGCLDAERVGQWARFCVALVTWAMDSDVSSMKGFLTRELARQQNGTGMDIWELARFLGLKDVAEKWEVFVLLKEKERELRQIERRLKKVAKDDETVPYKEIEILRKEVKMLRKEAEEQGQQSRQSTEPDVFEYNSDVDSIYAEEIAYYGRPGIEEDHDDSGFSDSPVFPPRTGRLRKKMEAWGKRHKGGAGGDDDAETKSGGSMDT